MIVYAPSESGVALLAEGVDRNCLAQLHCSLCHVALLAEGVDRNTFSLLPRSHEEVALLAEGVDRNSPFLKF